MQSLQSPRASAGPRLKPPYPRKVRVTRARLSLETRAQHCGTHWSQLLFRLGSASLLFRSISGTKDSAQHMLAVIRKFAPSTLERYLRIAHQFLCFLEACDIAFNQVSLAALLDYLASARASRSQDLEIHRISATSAIKALRWFQKLSQWEQLTSAMQSPVIAAYCSQSTAKDRKEAVPIPMALIAAWEQRVCDSTAPLCTVLCLGAALLAIHASLRFGDIQRVDFSSLSLTAAALHGVCFATKTTSRGQPFAVTIAGITGRDPSSCWPLHWLSAMHRAASPFREQDGDPDFLWVSTAPELHNLLELAPASYCTAMLVLRWAATLPWHPNSLGLTSHEASQLTLHSMKSTVLAAAAQLRLSKDIRLSQGHHRDSAALYSRNDTFDSLYAQRRLSLALSRGWRPQRSIARGGQAPVPEPPFTLPSTEPLAELPADALLQGTWSFFATRHEILQATLPLAPSTKATRAPLSPPASPRSPSFEPASHSDPCSDEEARMVEIAALRRQSSTSSHASTSSLSSDVPEPDASPTDKPLYACTRPWGCWHCLKPPDDSGVLRTACGLDLGLASFTSEEPPPPLCRHMACVIRRVYDMSCASPALFVCSLGAYVAVSMADASAGVPDALITALQCAGIDTVPDFAFAYATTQELDVFCSDEHAELWDNMGVSDPQHSPAMARLRRNAISWVPWQLRLSEKQYQEIIESRATKTLRTEAAFLSTALFDDTPEMPVDHLRLSPAWLGRIQTVFRNAIALCKGAHLQRLKAYDKQILDLATQAPSDASLRTVSTSELVSADRKLWKEISTLCASGWTLDDALHELTTVRSDVGNLLQLRARPPPPPLRPPRDPNAPLRGKGKTGKGKTGKGNAPPLKRKTPGTPAPPDNAPLDLV
ncbi:unnamed protein product, partial [Symbiodinium necroappetens]